MKLDLRKIFEGYVRNYQTFNINLTHSSSTYTLKEIEYFSSLGSMLGYDTFTEDTIDSQYRAMDLSWWENYSKTKDEWNKLILHLERENSYAKDEETLDKLSLEINSDWNPLYRIGIIHVRNIEKIEHLQKIAKRKFGSNKVILIYRVDKEVKQEYEVRAYLMDNPDRPIRAACRKMPNTDVFYMHRTN